MSLAFTIIAHKNPGQVVALADTVTAGGSHYCLIHCNVRSGPEFRAAVQAGLDRRGITTAKLMTSEAIAWGSSSIMKVQLRAIRQLLDEAGDWTHLVNLSGQCLPTKPIPALVDLLKRHPRTSFLECMDFVRDKPDLRYRISRYHLEINETFQNTRIPRPLPRGLRIHFGTFWGLLTREACSEILHSPEAGRVMNYLRFTPFPEEYVFQTILMNGPLARTIAPDPKRLILWEGGSSNPLVLKSEHWSRITGDDHYFARKFDPAADPAVIMRLGNLINCDLEKAVA